MDYDFIVDIEWTEFLRSDSELFKSRRVLYMYYTKYMPVYIGKADKQTVKCRLENHKKDGVVEWIKANIDIPVRIKVGNILYGDNVKKFSSKLLHDIESLLIFKERRRNHCGANYQNTITRGSWERPGMRIVNHGKHHPLLKNYFDS